MPYEIETRDGIVLTGIPDDWEPDDQRLKSMVERKRTEVRQANMASGATQEKYAKLNPSEYDPSSPEYQAKYGATAGMSGGEKVAANWSAGVRGFGLGAAQLALPKPLERAFGITDESIRERRAVNQPLADATTGGRFIQAAGEVAPTLAIPGGAVAKGLGMLPKVGQAIKGLGIGSRVLPTMLAEGAAVGGLQGAVTPTTSDESVLGNTVASAGMGAAIPGVLSGLGWAARPFSRGLAQRKVAGEVGEALGVDARAARGVERSVQASERRVVDSPQSLAALTQNPKVAQLEIASRSNPDFAPGWQQFDEGAGNARWKALDDVLGSDETVRAAKAETDAYANVAIPEVFKRVNRTKLQAGVADFRAAVHGRLGAAVRHADPNGQQVYGYVKKALEESDGSPQALWNIRKTISAWLDGAPPPGFEGTRGAKIDKPIMETRKAIDEVLNRATGGKQWTRFLEKFGEHAQRETAQKAGQNIRNAFFDETLVNARGATTSAGNPAVTRARLEQALTKFGKNEFGETLNWQQRNVVDQVLTDLRADEVLQRAKSAMTGKGGSQTGPLMALMKRQRVLPGGGWLSDIANALNSFGRNKQAQIVTEMLQDPQAALTIVKQAERLRRPLSSAERALVTSARAAIATPAALTMSEANAGDTDAQGVMSAATVASSFVPGAGDAIGLGADASMYMNNPDSRTPGNFLLTAASLLPGIPAASALAKSAKRTDAIGDFPSTTAGRIRNETEKKGGYSVNLASGEKPKPGLMVGKYANDDPRNTVLPAGKKIADKDIHGHAAKNRKALESQDSFFGTWRDPETGTAYFDVSKWFPGDAKRKAVKFGERTKQLAGYDTASGKTFPIGNWDEFVKSPEFQDRMREMEKVGRDYLSNHANKEWWDMHGSSFERVYGKENLRQLAGFIASTAPNAAPRENLQTATEYMRRFIKQEPTVQPDWRVPAGTMSRTEGVRIGMENTRAPNLEKSARGDIDALQQNKVREEAQALMGDPNAVVLDRHWARLAEDPARGILADVAEGKIAPGKAYDRVKDAVVRGAKAAGRDARDFSADVWTGIRETIKTKSDLFGTKYRGSAITGDSKAYADHFDDLIRDKAKHLGISVGEMESRLAKGDANLLSLLLATPLGAALYREYASERQTPQS
jgi:hypothetical protein